MQNFCDMSTQTHNQMGTKILNVNDTIKASKKLVLFYVTFANDRINPTRLFCDL